MNPASKLITIPELIEKAQGAGFNFGVGKPVHLIHHYVQIGLLPKATRLKTANISGHTIGCYPEDTVGLLLKIQSLRNQGIPVVQIREQLNKPAPVVVTEYKPRYVYAQRNWNKIGALFTIGLILGIFSVAGLFYIRKDLPRSNQSSPTPKVLAAKTVNGYLEVNSDANFSGALTASSISIGSLSFTGTQNQITNSGRQITIPAASGTLALIDAAQTLTNKTLSGSSNTFSNIPTSAITGLTDLKVTVSAGDNLSGGGEAKLGGSITLSLNPDVAISGSFRPPRLTAAQISAISSPSIGSLLYNTDTNSINIYNGTTWGAVGGVAYWSTLQDPNGDVLMNMGTYKTTWQWTNGGQIEFVNGNIYANNFFVGAGGTAGFLQRNDGSIAPANITDSLLIGGTATGSALFSVEGTTGNITVNGYLLSSLTPIQGSLYNLGSNTRHWNTIYADNIIGNITGDVDITGTTSNDWRINTDNATSDLEDTTITFERGLPAVNAELRWNSGTNRYLSTNVPFVISPDTGIPDNGRAAFIVNQPFNEDIFSASLAGVTKFVIDKNGNVGIGTTSPTAALDIAGTSSTISNSLGDITITPMNNLIISQGRMGIGTTSPLGILHVMGQCIWEGSLLPVRRRRKKKGDDEWDYLTLPIKDVLPGDEVLSLDELSGEFVYEKVNKKMDMGHKPVFEMILSDGRSLIATGEHPFLSKGDFGGSMFTQWLKSYEISEGDKIAVAPSHKQNIPFKPAGKPKLGIFVDDSNMFYAQKKAGWKIDLAKLTSQLEDEFDIRFVNYYLAVPGQKDPAFEPTMNFVRQLPKGVTLKTKPLKYIFDKTSGKTIKKGDVDLEIAMGVMENLDGLDAVLVLAGDSDYVDLRRAVVEKGKRIAFAAFDGSISWEIRLGKHLLLNRLPDLLALKPQKTPATKGGGLLLSRVYLKGQSLSRYLLSVFYKDENLEAITNNYREGDQVEWMTVVEKRNLGEKIVYDLEIENTHNFVANGIVAHNTTGKALVNINETGDQALFTASASGTTKFLITNSGNVGIGTTSPGYKLEVSGNGRFSSSLSTGSDIKMDWGFSTDRYIRMLYEDGTENFQMGTRYKADLRELNLYSKGVNGSPSITFSTGSNPDERMRINMSGSVGIGTTSPVGLLHVQGQCVAAGTLIRRRRKKKNGQWTEEDIPIEDINIDDEVQTLDEKSGQFVWSKVEQTLDKGHQMTFTLTTETGKKIRTTAEHPYLTRNINDITTNVFHDLTYQTVENLGRAYYESALEGKKIKDITFSHEGFEHIVHEQKSKLNILSRILGLTKVAIVLQESNKHQKYELKQVNGSRHEYWVYEKVIDRVRTQVVVRSVNGGHKHFYSVVWKGFEKENVEDTVSGISHPPRRMDTSQRQVHEQIIAFIDEMSRSKVASFTVLHKFYDLKWTKVRFLKKGQEISTVDGFEKIKSIEKFGTEQTFDLQIANTHNFVANGIVAHNTTGKALAIFNETGDQALFTASASGTTKFIIDHSGNVGIGTTSPSAPLEVKSGSNYQGTIRVNTNVAGYSSYGWMNNDVLKWSLYNHFGTNPVNSLIFNNAAGADKIAIDQNGNLGIGFITGLQNKIEVSGAVAIGSGYVGTAAPSNGMIIQGNVGIGTTSPIGLLHVQGQCVAAGTLIRRRRKKKNGQWTEEDIPVEDINIDDEVMTLDEKSSEFVWSKVEQTMDKGEQKVYELITETGKSLETTNEHPYFVWQSEKYLNFLQKEGFEFVEKEARKYYFANFAGKKIFCSALNEEINFTEEGWNHFTVKNRSLNELITRFFALPRAPFILKQGQKVGYEAVRKPNMTVEYWVLQEVIENVLVAVVVSSINHGPKFFLTSRWLGTKDRQGLKANKKELSLSPSAPAEAGRSGRPRRMDTSQLFNGLNISKNSRKVKWIKVKDIKIGSKVATEDGWERVLFIKEKGRVHTYDLQIANTHNFVANGIVAHNTTGKALAIFNETGDQALFTASASGTTKFVIDHSGNVGIGTTSPSEKLDVAGNVALRTSDKIYLDTGKKSYISSGGQYYWAINSAYGTDLQLSGSSGVIATSFTVPFVSLSTNPSYAPNISSSISNQKMSPSYGDVVLNPTYGGSYNPPSNDGGNVIANLGAGGNAVSGNSNGGNAGNFNVLLKAGGAASGSGTNGTASTFNILNSSSAKIFSVLNSGNVGIGTTSPAYPLDVTGSARIGGLTYNYDAASYNFSDKWSSQLLQVVNSGGVNRWTSTGTMSIYSTGGYSLSLGTGQTYGAILIGSSGTVAIGGQYTWNTNPGAQLEIDSSAAGTKGLIVKGASSQTANLQEWQNSGGSVLGKIGPTGILGLTPSDSINADSYASRVPYITFNRNNFQTSYGNKISSSASGNAFESGLYFEIANGASTYNTTMVLNGAGNVGIGTAAPSALLDIASAGTSLFTVDTSQINFNIPVAFNSPGDLSIANDLNFTNPTASWVTSNAALSLYAGLNYNNDNLTLGTYNLGNVIIDSQALVANYAATVSGQLQIGTSSATPNIGNFYLTNSQTFGKSLAILNQTETADIFTASMSGVTKFVVAQSGDVTIYGSGTTCTIGNGTGGTNCTSDVRLKENITNLGSTLDKVINLQPVNFTWKNGTTVNTGLIAQDVQKLFPELVHQVGDTGYLGIDYAGLTVPLIQATKDISNQLKDIPQIKSDIALLKEEMASASARLTKVETDDVSLRGELATKQSSLDPNQIAALASLARNDIDISTISGNLTVLGQTQLSNTSIGGTLDVGLLHLDDIKAEISSLNGLVTINSSLSVMGDATVSGQLKAKKGLVLEDTDTGEEYCVQVTKGEIMKKKGNCQ